MLTIKNASGASMKSYYQKDNYYLKGKYAEKNQEWHGELQKHYNVSGEVKIEDFNRVYDFKEKRAAYDLTFSSPKSISLAMTFPEYRDQVLNAHMKGVDYALGIIEKNDIFYWVQKNYEKFLYKSNNMIASKIMHEVSRQLDPQLHTHVLIKNRTKCHDGKLRAIKNEMIYKNYMLRGQQYKNMTIKSLMEEGFEIEITDAVKGLWEIKGTTRKQRDVFSKRRVAIINEANKRGVDIFDPIAMQKICLDIRKTISGIDVKDYMEDWEFEKDKNGITAKSFIKHNFSTLKDIDKSVFFHMVNKNIGEMKIGFTQNEYSLIALRLGMEYGVLQEDVDFAFNNLLKNKDILKTYIDGVEYYATVNSIDLEQSIFERIERGKNVAYGIGYENVLEYLDKIKNISGVVLTMDQEDGVKFFSTSKDRFSAITGIAGSGKTTMLSELKDLYLEHGYKVRGISFTGISVSLMNRAGINSMTAHSFFSSIARDLGKKDFNPLDISAYDFSGLKKGNGKEVWFVDEASQLNNLLIDRIVELAELKDVKVHFLGDQKQFGGIGAGNSFFHMIEENKIDYIYIKNNLRQKGANKNIRKAIMFNYNDELKKSVEMLYGNIIQIQDDNKRRAAIARDFCKLSKDERDHTFVTAGTNHDKIIINKKIRDILKAKNEISPDFRVFIVSDSKDTEFEIEIGIGEKLMFLKNNKNLGVNNGNVGEVIKISDNSLTIKVDEREIFVNLNDYNHFQYAYASTIYKKQGATAKYDVLAYYKVSQKGVNSIQGYTVNITRARRNVKIYVDDSSKFYDAINRNNIQVSSSKFVKDNKKTFKTIIDAELMNNIKDLKENESFEFSNKKYNKHWTPVNDLRFNKLKVSKLESLSAYYNGKNTIDLKIWNMVHEKSNAGIIMKFKNRDFPGVIMLDPKEYKMLFSKGHIKSGKQSLEFYGLPYRYNHDMETNKVFIEFSKVDYKKMCIDGLNKTNNIIENLKTIDNLSVAHVNQLDLNKYQKDIILNELFDHKIETPEFKNTGMKF